VEPSRLIHSGLRVETYARREASVSEIFALSPFSEHPLRVSLKCEPSLAEDLRKAHAAVTHGYHLNKRHWNTVTIDGSLSDEIIDDMIEDSYDLIVGKLPRSHQQALSWYNDP
jgi:predicted DNA-binding protein (MmcQ/YjbR family)